MFNERGIKEAFEKVKADIFNLGRELADLRSSLLDIKSQLDHLSNISLNQTYQHINPTHQTIPTDNPTVPIEIRGLKYPNLSTSTGNKGVPTDKQTDKQTDNPTHFYTQNQAKSLSQDLSDASEILASLDALKKEIRLKFKNMTNQEMLVFSTIYQLEEQFPEGISYDQIASKLKLSSSSIRDYTLKLISKGVPIVKEKLNNKKILLRISSELKKIASLETILKLREL